MTQRLDARLHTFQPAALALFRIIIGLSFAIHGTAKLFAWPVDQGGAAPVGAWPYWYAGVIELVVGVLVALGLFARIAALIGSGEMAFAYFTQHQPKALLPIENGGELSVLYCFSFLLIAFAGAGALALESRARRR
ncbi:DoxX family protein [Mycolicibacterium sp. CBM1]